MLADQSSLCAPTVHSVQPASGLHAIHADFLAERLPETDEDVHMLASIAEHVIATYSEPGHTVFDPFAGFGTTLERATALGRAAIGIELLPERVEPLSARVPRALVIEGDARELLRLLVETPEAQRQAPVDLILTSPPYMTEHDHEADPLTAYERDGGDYGRYLAELGLVAAQCARAVRPGGFVVWNVADIHFRDHTTQLIHDCTGVLSEHLSHVETVPIHWDRLPHDLVADALLVFQRPDAH
ncbi:SAM-dependent methyltransferase [Leucobacter exalbidus]|uniref:Methyltransferase n=1 Tax=Leucobacter exalbidus TaxID=662960 RepID=A0A940PQQ8_9MICO|nr:DNA methyltransferase [Leucobacter exalbidus]MBP1324822.1 SAM-dependent methyltransferase [Leucobacter exalbidus]